MFPTTKLILACAATAALAGCGGGGGGAPAPATLSGAMIDGYVSGATVFCDVNNNGTLDANESSTTTNTQGVFTFATGCNATIVGSGGLNADTTFPFTGQLKSPAGSTVITPLTTLIASSTLTLAQLAEQLSVPVGTDVTTIDIANGQNQDLLKKTLAVQQIMDNLTKIIISKGGSTDAKVLYSSIAAEFGKTLAAAAPGAPLISTSGDINSTLLSTFVKALPDIVLLGITNADLDAAINSIAAEAQMFAKASDAGLAGLTQSLQNPANPPINVSTTTSFLALSSDTIALNGEAVSLVQLGLGATTTGLTSVGFNLTATGSPAADTTSSVALELIEQGGKARTLQLMIDQVNLKLNAQNQLAVTVPVGAKVYAYGHTGNGTDINLTLTDLTFTPINVVGNGFSLNYANMVNKVLASADNTTKSTAQEFVAIKGTFAVKVVLSKVNLRHADASAFTNQTIALTNTAQSVTGAGFAGSLTIN